ncbi:NAD-dependent deacylase [Methylobacterium organophilum]|uniref:NAD-dependent protein deacylase n=1 Tax=Methylobacterium organophilum TaxID=410 RepID=A0ABQ4THG8_METOR|nr:NAD-dependent deacylase [Methylobacterium organophilum]GJE29467.1 NAD-dependent protein deacylase [Methylobacterium organophilum]
MLPKAIFVLTGAGVSAESGLGTFRDRGGLWSRFDPMKLATPEAFAADPDEVHAFYNLRRRGVIEAEPNPAHHALARLEKELRARGGRLFLCTQNVDDLHERAGSNGVTHMHGELLKARCTACEAVLDWREDLDTDRRCPECSEPGGLRPDIVWFGEMPKHLDAIDAALRGADLFVAIGTSGSVYPAAGYVETARRLGIRSCAINLEPSDNASTFDERLYGLASEAVPAFVGTILG